MADVKSIIGHLTCPVCFNLFENPKYLSCHHSFCKGCLEMMQPQSVISCPICRKETSVPEGGVMELGDSFFISSLVDELVKSNTGVKNVRCEMCEKEDPVTTYCVECVQYLCHSCDARQHETTNTPQHRKIVPLTESRTNKIDDTSPKQKPKKYCSIHNAELFFYCETCDQLACVHCRAQHDGHQCLPVQEIAGKYRDELKEATAPMKVLRVNLSETVDAVDKMIEKIYQEADEVNKHIDEHHENFIQKLEEQKRLLKQQVSDSVSARVKLLETKLEKLKHAQAEVQNVKQMTEALISSFDQELLSTKSRMISRMQHTTNKHKKLVTDITQHHGMKFVPNLSLLPQFGWLCSTATPAPYKCELVDLPADVCENQMTSLTIVTKDTDGYLSCREDTQVSSQLDDKHLKVSDSKNGQYTVSLLASKVGDANLSVNVNGAQIKGSPFKIMIHRLYTTINKPLKMINNDNQLGRPWGISFSRDGMWAVTDYSWSSVYIYNSNNESVKMIGSPGRREEQFECPFGVAFDDSNNLYVVDNGNTRVQKFDPEGKYLLQFGQEHLVSARGITIHNNRVYVTDRGKRCIVVFDIDGQYCDSIKSQHLRTPCGVTVGVNNHLYVTDNDNRCIHTFTLDGSYICKLGTAKMSSGGQFRKPWDIATDMSGNLLVTDADSHLVSILGKEGVPIHCFGTYGKGDGEFDAPLGIAVSPQGNIYVCDYKNNRIQVY